MAAEPSGLEDRREPDLVCGGGDVRHGAHAAEFGYAQPGSVGTFPHGGLVASRPGQSVVVAGQAQQGCDPVGDVGADLQRRNDGADAETGAAQLADGCQRGLLGLLGGLGGSGVVDFAVQRHVVAVGVAVPRRGVGARVEGDDEVSGGAGGGLVAGGGAARVDQQYCGTVGCHGRGLSVRLGECGGFKGLGTSGDVLRRLWSCGAAVFPEGVVRQERVVRLSGHVGRPRPRVAAAVRTGRVSALLSAWEVSPGSPVRSAAGGARGGAGR